MVKENLTIKNEKKEIIPTDLSFEDLKRTYELVNTTFREVEDGFECVNGDILEVYELRGIYKLRQCAQRFHNYILSDSGNIFRKGTTNKEEIIEAIRLMIIETGNRIIK